MSVNYELIDSFTINLNYATTNFTSVGQFTTTTFTIPPLRDVNKIKRFRISQLSYQANTNTCIGILNLSSNIIDTSDLTMCSIPLNAVAPPLECLNMDTYLNVGSINGLKTFTLTLVSGPGGATGIVNISLFIECYG